jgi:regulator of protease activity HflC (stomatin/prohibitin superfamily)
VLEQSLFVLKPLGANGRKRRVAVKKNLFGLGKILRVGVGVLILIALSGVFYSTCYTYIKPNEFAVKESRFGDGILPEVYEGGHVYFTNIGVTFHRFPRMWQVLDFNSIPEERGLEDYISGYNYEPSLEIPSSDGFLNQFDITIIYRIVSPSTVIDKDKGVGRGDLFKDFVKTKADPALKEALGKMAAEQIYNVDIRLPYANEAKKILNRELNPMGIEVGEVLIRKFKYMPEYESKISAKVLQSQLQIANTQQALAEEIKAEVRKINAQGQAAVEVEINRAGKEKRVIDAQAGLYERQQMAAGNLLVKESQAKGQELLNRAYEGSGAEKIIGIEMARKVQSIKKIYLKSCKDSGANPLDIEQMVRKLTGK